MVLLHTLYNRLVDTDTQEVQIVFQLAFLHGTSWGTDHQSACQAMTKLFTGSTFATCEFASNQIGAGFPLDDHVACSIVCTPLDAKSKPAGWHLNHRWGIFRTHAPLHGLTPTNQIKLFYAGAYSKTTGKKKVKGVPPGAAKALLQLLFLLVQRLESWTHEGPARKQPFQMKLMASHRLYLGELTMSCAVHVMCNTFHVQYMSCAVHIMHASCLQQRCLQTATCRPHWYTQFIMNWRAILLWLLLLH